MARRDTSLDALFRPRSVAVVGATARHGALGRTILENLLRAELPGPVYPVSRTRRTVCSVPAWPDVRDIPGEVDLAVIVVPAAEVPGAVAACGEKGVRALVIITAGFKEIGGEGAALEREVTGLCERYGMRAIGPNCMGILNTDPEARLNASFARTRPSPGRLAFMSQSGALGDAILSYAPELNLGISMFASIGNKMDVDNNDLLAYWQGDPRTGVILMYLESFGDPRRFVEVATEVSRHKPILAVKSGSTVAGAKAAFSHTGSLAGGDEAVNALFADCGVLRCRSVEQLFEAAHALQSQPIPAGGRVAIVTNAGGPGIMAADACDDLGLTVAALSARTRRKMQPEVNPYAALGNPVDLIASATPEDYRVAVDACLGDPGVDAAIVLFVPPVITAILDVAHAIREAAAKHPDKPVLVTFMTGADGAEAVRWLRAEGLPVYRFPESAATSLEVMVRYGAWRAKPRGRVRRFKVDRAAAKALVDGARAEGREVLDLGESVALLEAYGIPVAASEVAATRNAALAAAARLGYPVVLKADDPRIVHKSDVGGVVVDLRDPKEVGRAFDRVRAAMRRAGVPRGRVRIQQMIPEGTEVLLGMSRDPHLGPLVAFGLGGVLVEALEQVTFKVPPLTDRAAADLLDAGAGATLLAGHRGRPPVDRRALQEILERFSQLVGDLDADLAEVDVNPVMAAPRGRPTVAVDARVRLTPAAGVGDRPRRR